MMEKIKAIITGSTGMVGEGVLLVCLQDPRVESVLVMNRKPCGITDPKLKETIVPDFLDLSQVESDLNGYNACFFCAGVSSVGMKEAEYTRFTYDLTMNVAQTLSRLNPDMVFCYVSGAGTDSTEKGRMMWARVKGKTENDLMKLPFRGVYGFRPALMKPVPGMKNTHSAYRYLGWLFPLVKAVSPSYVLNLSDVGLAMINCAVSGNERKVLESKDIATIAK